MIRHRLPKQTTSSQASSSSRLSDFKNYVSRRRCCLGSLCVLVIAGMIIGIMFAAHKAYHDFGGQGWLKARTQNHDVADNTQLYLPMRPIQIFKKRSFWERTMRGDVPYYTCGDQQNSCESFGQPVSWCFQAVVHH